MNLPDSALAPVFARVDADGLLASAEPRLLDMIGRAGGGLGAGLPVPELAALARLAQRLGITIAREITVADGDDDLDLMVRAEPDRTGVVLTLSGWQRRPGWRARMAEVTHDTGFAAITADWTWETDAALRITDLPLAAGLRYGFDAAALLGQPLLRLFALAEDSDGSLPILSAVAARQRFDAQLAELRDNGRRLRLSAVPRIDANGRFAGFVGTAHMLDDEPSVREAGELAQDKSFPEGFSERLERALRGPLKRIIANAGAMNAEIDGPLGEAYAGYAGDIATAGRHLLGLVDDLVDLEAIERDDFAVLAEPIDLADVARRAAGLLSVRASDRNVRIDRPATNDRLPAVGDFRRTLQILVNLIANAVRYSPDGGTIWVRVERDGDRGCAIVADQGKGIAPQDQALIFEKFGRVDPNEAGGSGLGLYISRRLARAMGGDVSVDGASGQGARFVFTLPLG